MRQTESLWWDAEAAYISNLKYAANECEKVCRCICVVIEPIDRTVEMIFNSVFVSYEYVYSCVLQHGITVLIEPISIIPNYFLRHQNQGRKFLAIHSKHNNVFISYASPFIAIEIIKKVACPNLKLEFVRLL